MQAMSLTLKSWFGEVQGPRKQTGLDLPKRGISLRRLSSGALERGGGAISISRPVSLRSLQRGNRSSLHKPPPLPNPQSSESAMEKGEQQPLIYVEVVRQRPSCPWWKCSSALAVALSVIISLCALRYIIVCLHSKDGQSDFRVMERRFGRLDAIVSGNGLPAQTFIAWLRQWAHPRTQKQG
jgi:hypothetical protein